MKYKVFALFLALTVASWAQTATQTEPAAPQSAPAKSACCEKMASANAKDSHACMHHDMKSSDGKEMSLVRHDVLLRRQGCEVLHEEREGR